MFIPPLGTLKFEVTKGARGDAVDPPVVIQVRDSIAYQKCKLPGKCAHVYEAILESLPERWRTGPAGCAPTVCLCTGRIVD